jgi:cytochrome c
MTGPVQRRASLLLALAALAGCGGDDQHDERLRAAGPRRSLGALLKVADVDAGARKFGQCTACHSILEGAGDRDGPNLFGVYGKGMGQNSARFGYTAALASAGGHWDAPTLDAWLVKPSAVVPGTKMQFAGVPDALDRADIIAYLRTQK